MSGSIDQLALGEKIGALAAQMVLQAEIQANWRNSIREMIDNRLAIIEGDVAEIRADGAATRADVTALKETISGFRLMYTIGKTAVVSAVVVAGAVIVILALGFEEGSAWIAKKLLSFFV